MVAGLDVVAPAGRLTLPALPASAAGPDLRHLVLGSEGRLGVITEATLRVRPRPQEKAVVGALLPDLEIQIGRLSQATGLGRHTTSTTSLYRLPQGGELIDLFADRGLFGSQIGAIGFVVGAALLDDGDDRHDPERAGRPDRRPTVDQGLRLIEHLDPVPGTCAHRAGIAALRLLAGPEGRIGDHSRRC